MINMRKQLNKGGWLSGGFNPFGMLTVANFSLTPDESGFLRSVLSI
ncbi:MAG: hypothetical protein WDZ64_01515 [Parcubacteria group bacterium]